MRLPLETLDIRHHFSHGMYAKQVHLKAGIVGVQHRHNFAHMTILATGQAVYKSDDDLAVLYAPCVVNIPAGKHHSFTAVTDCVLFCIHATDETDPVKIDASVALPPNLEDVRDLLG